MIIIEIPQSHRVTVTDPKGNRVEYDALSGLPVDHVVTGKALQGAGLRVRTDENEQNGTGPLGAADYGPSRVRI